jgi:hypothetical protein
MLINNIYTNTFWGQWYGNQAYNVDFTVGTHSGMAKTVFVSVGFSHYNTGYQVNHIGWHYVYGGSYLNGNTIQNNTTGNSGAFSFSTPSSGLFRVTKSAGSYGGIGYVTMCVWSPI